MVVLPSHISEQWRKLKVKEGGAGKGEEGNQKQQKWVKKKSG